MERLETAAAVLWPKVLDGNVAAVDRWLRIRSRVAALTGLDLGRSEPGPQFTINWAGIPMPPPPGIGNVVDVEVLELSVGENREETGADA